MENIINREMLLANVYLTKPSQSKNWYYRFKYEKTKHSTHLSNRQEAEDYVFSILLGKPLHQDIPTLNEFSRGFFDYTSSQWINRQHAKGKRFSKSHAKDRNWALNQHILPQFGKRVLSSITAIEIENYLLNLDLSNQSKNHILYTLRTVLKEAVRQNIILKNTANDVEPFALNSQERDIYSTLEIQSLFPTNIEKFIKIWEDPRVGLLCLLALTTGMRHEEVRALKWEDIIEDNTLIQITKAVTRDNTLGPTKNGESRITFLIDRLRPVLEYVHKSTSFKNSSDFIFTTRGKAPFWPSYTYKIRDKAFENIKLNKGERKLDIHSFRHTYVTITRKHGLDEKTLKQLIGHKVKTITDVYDHRELHDILSFLIPYRKSLEKIWEAEFTEKVVRASKLVV